MLLPDVRIMMTAGYLPVMLVAVLAQPGRVLADHVHADLAEPQPADPDGGRRQPHGPGDAGAARRPARQRRQARSGASRYAVAVAVAVPVFYAVTRFGWLLGIPVGISDEFLAYIDEITPIGASLAAVGLLGAVLTLGLVRPWGEVWPRWVPFLRGRPVPARLPACAALAVSLPITSAGLMYVRKKLGGERLGPAGAGDELGAWLPEMLWPLWGAALAVAALAYLSRRNAAHGRRP
ncbi:hypothetical protein ACFSTC_28495 [Nonomuraea ferruginea]